MATATRRRKKNAARGHVATPDLIIQPGELIPGVPAFEDGGSITVPTRSDIAIGGGEQFQRDPNTNAAIAFLVAQGMSRQDAIGLVTLAGGQGALDWLGQQQGAGAAPAGPAWRPGEQHLAQLAQDLARDRLELDRAIADGNWAMEREIQDRIDQREAVSNMIRAREAGLQAEVTQRGQDISALISVFETLAANNRALIADARAAGDQALMAQGLEDARVIADAQNMIEQAKLNVEVRGQDIVAETAYNAQLVDLWGIANRTAIDLGNLEVARFSEERLAAADRQQVALDQYDAALAGAGLQITAQQGAATTMGQLAQSFGDIQARRQENLLETWANPRDWMQAQLMMGGGQNPFDALTRGVTPEGQAIGRSQGSPLGAGFNRLATAATERLDIPYFEEARDMARRLQGLGGAVPRAPSLQMLQGLGQFPQMGAMPTMAPQPNFQMPNLPGFGPVPGLEDFLGNFGPVPTPPPAPPLNPLQQPQLPPQFQFKKGGELTITEPTVGIGLISGKPLFTLVEDGKPEKLRPTATGMEVVPFQAGGNVNWWDASRLTKKPRATAPNLPGPRDTRYRGPGSGWPGSDASRGPFPPGATRPPGILSGRRQPIGAPPPPTPPFGPRPPGSDAVISPWKPSPPGFPPFPPTQPQPAPGTVAPAIGGDIGVPPFPIGTAAFLKWKAWVNAGSRTDAPPFIPGTPEYQTWLEWMNMPAGQRGEPWDPMPTLPEPPAPAPAPAPAPPPSAPGTVTPQVGNPFTLGTPEYLTFKLWQAAGSPTDAPPFQPGTPEYQTWLTWMNRPPDMRTGDPWEPAPEPPQFVEGWRPPGNAQWRNPGGTSGWGFWNPIQGSSGAGARVSVPGQDWNRSGTGLDVSAQFDRNGEQVRLVRNPLTGEERTQIIGTPMSEVFPEVISAATSRRMATRPEGVPEWGWQAPPERDFAAEQTQNLAKFNTMLQGMTQQIWQGMSWSAQQMFLSAGSSVGWATEDIMRSMQNQWPVGADPSQTFFGTNF